MIGLQYPVNVRDRIRGAEDAATLLVLYGDYECPFSRQANAAIQALLVEWAEEVRYVFRPFPLARIHPHAQRAAEAAEAAADQGRFWLMHQTLFAHQMALTDNDLVRYALSIDLDLARFVRDLSMHAHARQIAESVRSGKASGVQATPTLFINGQRYESWLDEGTLRETIAPTFAGRLEANRLGA
jgi:protein-disulfide isomerase